MEPVRSHRNTQVVEAARLHRARVRRDTRQTLIEGPHALASAVAAGVQPSTVFALAGDCRSIDLARSAGARVVVVTDDVLGKVAGTKTPRGPVAVVAIPGSVMITDRPAVVLVGVADPGNAGTIVRSAAAFGFGVICIGGADIWAPKVLRAAAGAQFFVPIERHNHHEEADLAGRFTTVATVAHGGQPPDSVAAASRPALLIGSEPHGLPEALTTDAALRVTIPMAGQVESLNAGVASAILMYDWARRNAGSAQAGP